MGLAPKLAPLIPRPLPIPPMPPRAEAASAASIPNEATANNAIIVLRNMTVLRSVLRENLLPKI